MMDSKARAVARERILRILGTTQRPLRWAELTEVLGTLSEEGRTECEWLMDHGYIAPVRGRGESVPDDEARWTFGDRGLAWATRNGARPRSMSGNEGRG